MTAYTPFRTTSILLALPLLPAALADDCNVNGIPDNIEIMPTHQFQDTVVDTYGNPSSIFATAVLTDGSTVPLDVNGDGHGDVLIDQYMGDGQGGPPLVRVHLGDGQGGFDAGTVYPVGVNGSWSAIAGDMDGDDDHDLVVCNPDDLSVFVLINDGTGNFPAEDMLTWLGESPQAPRLAALADIDGDGDVDVALNTGGFGSIAGEFRVLFNNGDGGLAAGEPIVTGFGSCVLAEDFDGDDDIDIALDAEGITILLNDQGDFPSIITLSAVVGALDAADVDQDGDMDLVGSAGTSLQFFANDGSAVFDDPVSYETHMSWHDFELGDLNGDGTPDILGVGFEGELYAIKLVAYALGDGTGAFGDSLAALELSSLIILGPVVSLVDVDHDDDLDAIYADYAGSFHVLLHDDEDHAGGDCNGNGIPDICDLAGELEYADAAALDVGQNDPFEIMATSISLDGVQSPLDLNGDGWLDLVYSGEGGWMSVVLNRGDDGGTWLGWADRVDYETANDSENDSGATGLAAGDIDGDGHIDVLASGVLGFVEVFFNNADGTGTLGSGQDVNAENAVDVALADVNDDGLLDLVFVVEGEDEVWVAFNEDNRVFSDANEVKKFAVGDFPAGIAAGDIDGDGDMDLAIACRGTNDDNPVVSVLVNDGTGDFPAADTITLDVPSGSPFHLVLADLTGSGRPDLAVVNRDTDSKGDVVVMLNDGTGQFGPGTSYHINIDGDSEAHHVCAADLDGDGDLDLVLALQTGVPGDVGSLLNAGDGSFVRLQGYPCGQAPSAVAAGDCDGDGDIDLVSADRFEPSVSVLRQQAVLPGFSRDINGNGIPDDCEEGYCPGDVDGDGMVGIHDLLDLLENWNTAGSGGTDINGDGVVNSEDLIECINHWGVCE